MFVLLASCSSGFEDSERTYTVGGTIRGLSGTVVLQNNSADDLTLTADGTFEFATVVADGGGYVVTVKTQPTGQTCTVSSGAGTISGGNVTTVSVVCSTNTYTVGGTLSGLSGTVVLQNNSADDLTLTADGTFEFATVVADGGGYAVTVKTQPTGQTCTVSSGAGTISGGNVTTVAVSCVTNYTVGGTVSDLSGTVVLQNNSVDNLTLTTNGSFTFATARANGSTYAVTVLTQPGSQTCTVSNGSGTISGGNVTAVTVSCTNNPCTTCIVFVTSTTSTGNLGGLAGADATCNTLAGDAGLDGTFVAWLSTSDTDAKDRIVDASYVMTNGTGIALSLDILIDPPGGSIASEIRRDESNNDLFGLEVWTGTNADGTKHSSTCSDWTSSTAFPTVGRNGNTNAKNFGWTSIGSGSCDAAKRLYCFQIEE